jgi:hypothetical protein
MNAQAQLYGNRPPAGVLFKEPIDLLGSYATPSNGRIFVVRGDGTSVLNYDDQYTNQMPGSTPVYASIAQAHALTVADRGDTIMVMGKHTENLATTLTLNAGVRILGIGWGNTRPVVTLTAAGSQVIMAGAGCIISNIKFVCDGTAATTVTKAFDMTGEGASLIGCEFHLGTSNTQKCATLLSVQAANCRFISNKAYADTQATALTNVIVLGAAATGADDFVCIANYMVGAMSAATTGLIANIASTATSNRVLIQDNFLFNWKSDSSACISFAGNQVTTGAIVENTLRVMNNASVQGIVVSGTGVDVSMDNNRIVNDVNETAKQNQGTVSA